MFWIIDRLIVGVLRLLVVFILLLVLRGFFPEWWEMIRWIGRPSDEAMKLIKELIAAEQQYRWISLGILGALWIGLVYVRDRVLARYHEYQPGIDNYRRVWKRNHVLGV